MEGGSWKLEGGRWKGWKLSDNMKIIVAIINIYN
jgi:hypothetical protein